MRRLSRAAGAALVAATLAAPSSGSAFEIVASTGADDLRGDPTPVAGLEVRSSPLWRVAAVAVGLAAAAEAGGDLWAAPARS